MTPLIQQARERAPYYREWAKDIRGNNGTSVDADHADGTADLLDRLATALSSAEEEKQRAVSEEREACADVCTEILGTIPKAFPDDPMLSAALCAVEIVRGHIRSRSLNAGKQGAGDGEER